MNKQERKSKIKLAKNLYEKYKFAKQQAREMKWKIVKISDELLAIASTLGCITIQTFPK